MSRDGDNCWQMSSAQRKLYKLLPSWFVLSRNSKISDITNNVFCDKAERSSLQEQQLFQQQVKRSWNFCIAAGKPLPVGKAVVVKA